MIYFTDLWGPSIPIVWKAFVAQMTACEKQENVILWVATQVLPHERAVRSWLRRHVDVGEIEDIVQECYTRIASVKDVGHIRDGRSYLFATARTLILERIRRARIVRIDAVADFDLLQIDHDQLCPERIAAGRQELARVIKLIEGLPERCRNDHSTLR